MGPGGMMDQSMYPSGMTVGGGGGGPIPPGGGGQLPPGVTSMQQQQQQQPPSMGSSAYSHPSLHPNDIMSSTPSSLSNSNNTSTQHLTSASLASLARLSQLSGSEGPYCSAGPTNSLPSGASTGSTPGFSRMTSAPDMLGVGGFPGGGMLSNPEGDPSCSMYTGMLPGPGNPNTPGYQQQQPMPQGAGPQVS